MSDLVESNVSKYIDTYNNFIKQLKVIFSNKVDVFTLLEEELDNLKLDRGDTFVNSFNDDNFDLFVKSKIKAFSHKNEQSFNISKSLFDDSNGECYFYLKELLNNQPDQVKEVIWLNLHTLYYLVEVNKTEPNKERLEMLTKVLVQPNNNDTYQLMFNRINDLVGDEVNESTKEMMNDMIRLFHDSLTNSKDPASKIIDMTKLMTTKYSDKITNGEIQVEALIKAIISKIPGVNPDMMNQIMGMMGKSKPKEKVIIDENFSTANIDVGVEEAESSINLRNALKMVNMFNKEGMPNLSDIKDIAKQFQGEGGIDIDKMTDMFKQMQEDGTIPSNDKMKEMFSNLQSDGSLPNMDVIMNMVDEFQKNPSMDNMFEMFEKIQKDNLLPSMDQVNDIITKIQENNDLPDINELLQLAEK